MSHQERHGREKYLRKPKFEGSKALAEQAAVMELIGGAYFDPRLPLNTQVTTLIKETKTSSLQPLSILMMEFCDRPSISCTYFIGGECLVLNPAQVENAIRDGKCIHPRIHGQYGILTWKYFDPIY